MSLAAAIAKAAPICATSRKVEENMIRELATVVLAHDLEAYGFSFAPTIRPNQKLCVANWRLTESCAHLEFDQKEATPGATYQCH